MQWQLNEFKARMSLDSNSDVYFSSETSDKQFLVTDVEVNNKKKIFLIPLNYKQKR